MYRKKIGMLVAEFLGTAVLTLTALTVALMLGLPYFTAVGVGTALGLMVLVVGNASGAHVNPAVTIGFWSIRKIPTLQAAAYIAAQLLGALAAGRLFVYMAGKPLEDMGGKPLDWKIMFVEAFGAFIFTFGIAAAVYQGYKGIRLAFTVGTSLFIGILFASVASNGIINPAIALGINSVSWGYMLGPVVGALVGMNIYALLFSDMSETITGKKPAKVTASEDVPVKPSTPKAASTSKSTSSKSAKTSRATKTSKTSKTAKTSRKR